MTCYYCDLIGATMPYSYVLKFVKARASYARRS